MAALTYFSVTADMLAVVGAAGTPATVPIRGKVTFTPMIHSGDALLLTTLSPRPGIVSPQPVTGVIGSDGRLGFGGAVGVRLIADTSVLGLSSPLFYTVTFTGLTVNGVARDLTPFNFQAAQSDTPINLVTVARVPGQLASGIVNNLTPDHVRLNGSNQVVFSANGVDLPDPLPIGSPADVRSFGAKGDGSTDDTAALAAAAAAAVPLKFPAGTYLTSAPIIQRDASVAFDPGVTIKATASMAAVWQVGSASIIPLSKRMDGSGLVLDCNGLASVGLSLYSFWHFEADSVDVKNTALHGFVAGDPGASTTPFEAILHNCHTLRDAPWIGGPNVAVPSGGRGLWVRTATDGEYDVMDLVGNDVGVRADTGGNRFVQVHPWGYQGHLPATSFDDRANFNSWIGCGADSPSVQGWSINGTGSNLVSCNHYSNTFVTDNTVIGVAVESANANLTVVGMTMTGVDSSHRIHQDFGGAHGVDSATIIGHTNTNVVNQNVYQVTSLFGTKARFNADVKFAETGTPVLVTDGGDVAYFSVNTSTDATFGKQIAAANGADLAGWSDNYSTLKWKLKGLTGALLLGRFVTGSRPSASTAGQGAQVFDTTLNRPIWSDGASWIDPSDIAASTHAATSKTPPVDADELPLVDSAASNVLKKLTWASLKATIKAYYDTVTSTMTNKTLTSPVINSPTGIVKGDVGLGNVDNTSDAAKNSAAVTLSSKTLSSPKIDHVLDTNGNFILDLGATASAVNFAGITNAAAGGTPSIYVTGSDPNVGLDIWTQGTGPLRVNGNPVGVKVGVPASAGAAGAVGQWAADSSWHYVCTATNTWVRSAAATW